MRVPVGGVDEVATGLEEGVEHPLALRVGRAPAHLLAERHRAQREL